MPFPLAKRMTPSSFNSRPRAPTRVFCITSLYGPSSSGNHLQRSAGEERQSSGCREPRKGTWIHRCRVLAAVPLFQGAEGRENVSPSSRRETSSVLLIGGDFQEPDSGVFRERDGDAEQAVHSRGLAARASAARAKAPAAKTAAIHRARAAVGRATSSVRTSTQ